MRKIIITGATSFIGSELCRWFLANGDTVYGICRKSSPKIKDLPIGINRVYADLSSLYLLKDYIEEADVFINLAWEGTGHDGRNTMYIQRNNVRNTLNAMKIAKTIRCKLFIESGSQAEYGSKTTLITEDTVCDPFSDYGKAKLQVWQEGAEYCKSVGMKYIHLRIFSTYGENDHPWTLVMSAVDKMLKNEDMQLSPCTQMWNFFYVKDEVKLIGKLCNHAMQVSDFTQEIYNIASATSRPLKEYVERIKELTHSNSNLIFGAIQPTNLVSLNVSVDKSYKTAKFKEEFSFDEVICKIIKNTIRL